MCFCPSNKLRDVDERFPYRTEIEMKSLVEEIQRSSSLVAVELSKRFSIHPIQVCYFILFFSCYPRES